jgi:hypothetical protein
MFLNTSSNIFKFTIVFFISGILIVLLSSQTPKIENVKIAKIIKYPNDSISISIEAIVKNDNFFSLTAVNTKIKSINVNHDLQIGVVDDFRIKAHSKHTVKAILKFAISDIISQFVINPNKQSWKFNITADIMPLFMVNTVHFELNIPKILHSF